MNILSFKPKILNSVWQCWIRKNYPDDAAAAPRNRIISYQGVDRNAIVPKYFEEWLKTYNVYVHETKGGKRYLQAATILDYYMFSFRDDR